MCSSATTKQNSLFGVKIYGYSLRTPLSQLFRLVKKAASLSMVEQRGAGIFITPSIVYEDSGSVGVDLLVWLAAGVASFIRFVRALPSQVFLRTSFFGQRAFVTPELGTMLPSAGGAHEYLRVGMKSMGRTGDVISFLYVWCFLLVDPTAVTVQGLTFTAYALSLPYGSCPPPHAVTVLVTVVTVELAAVVNTFSLKTSMKIQNAFFMLKLGVLLAIIGTGVVWCMRAPHVLRNFTFGTSTPPGNILQAFVVAMYTGSGSTTISCMAEEMSNPSRIIPRSLLGGVFLVTCLQVLTNAAYFAVLDHEAFSASEATAVTFGRVTRCVPLYLWDNECRLFQQQPAINGRCTQGTFARPILSDHRTLVNSSGSHCV
ncbi:hypothetical protein HPB50_026664 [Hyalomma asiaticum]|uniref:Uncharacterized protein n=1 Tax=Hyalomma asiaticum TaxID=266040 RepID=A0ACB7RQN6_HYAAI|nr:hypothetical protein HPB50_026664 [Hyalomma asiaticum]